MTQLNDIRVLITGATSGLGAAMATALIEAGARVMVTGRDEGRAGPPSSCLSRSTLGERLSLSGALAHPPSRPSSDAIVSTVV